MGRIAIFVVVVVIGFVLAIPQIAQGAVCKVSGTALDQYRIPVGELMLEAWPLGVAVMGPVPRAKTDASGHFVFNLVCSTLPDGHPARYALYPRDERLYYPNLSSQFYSTGLSHSQVIELSPEHPEMTVELKLGPRAGAIIGNATDAVTGKPVKPYFEFAWVSNPRNRMGEGTAPSYRILVPSNTGITFWVAATGYKRYTYPGVINLGPRQDFKLDIQLQPDKQK